MRSFRDLTPNYGAWSLEPDGNIVATGRRNAKWVLSASLIAPPSPWRIYKRQWHLLIHRLVTSILLGANFQLW